MERAIHLRSLVVLARLISLGVQDSSTNKYSSSIYAMNREWTNVTRGPTAVVTEFGTVCTIPPKRRPLLIEGSLRRVTAIFERGYSYSAHDCRNNR